MMLIPWTSPDLSTCAIAAFPHVQLPNHGDSRRPRWTRDHRNTSPLFKDRHCFGLGWVGLGLRGKLVFLLVSSSSSTSSKNGGGGGGVTPTVALSLSWLKIQSIGISQSLQGGVIREMLKFLNRKDVRKILKRKDSDAGERGRALEDLRASLFDEFRTFDVAKRQQQRICGPTVALTFNFLVAVGIILVNKLVLGNVGFNYPICLTFIHYTVSWILMGTLKVMSVLPSSPPLKSTHQSSLWVLGIVMSLSTGLANVSLKFNSVGFYQMAKIAVTPTIVLAEFIIFGKRVSFKKVLALSLLSIGVAVATVTDLQFHFFGACVALLWIFPSAVNKILWSNLQQQENWTALALMWKTTPITLFFLLILMRWLDPPGILSFKWNFRNTSAIMISALLGFLLQWSGALALGATSATTHVVLGQFKTCVILLGGFILYGSYPGLISICGAITALAGMSAYTYLNLQTSSQQPSGKPSAKQGPFSLSKSKMSRENGDAGNVNGAAESV